MRSLMHVARMTGVCIALALSAALSAAAQTAATTVIVVRHAEKGTTPANDPPLTAAGEQRARDLWDAIRDAGVSVVITTQFARTRATGMPTATEIGVTPEVVPAAGATHVQDVAAAVKRHAGHTILVVGHSNTVPEIVEALGAKRPPAICDAAYDNLYIVTIPPAGAPGAVGVIHSRFGAPTPVTASCGAMK